MADTSLNRQAAALYRALTKLMPEGADRLEMNLHDIVTKGGATRTFTVDGELNDNAVKQAWRHLATIGAVENLGPRFKRPVRDPREIDTDAAATADGTPAIRSGRRGRKAAGTAKASSARKTGRARKTTKAAGATKGTARRTTKKAGSRPARAAGATTKRGGRRRGAAVSNGAAAIESTPTPSALAGQLSVFQAQLEESLQSLQRLRQEINDSYEHLARLEDEHNTIVSDLLAFRENLGDTNQRSFVDSIVGDNLWSYAPRS